MSVHFLSSCLRTFWFMSAYFLVHVCVLWESLSTWILDMSTEVSLRGFGTSLRSLVCGVLGVVHYLFGVVYEASLRTLKSPSADFSIQVYGLFRCKSTEFSCKSTDFSVQVYELFQSPQTWNEKYVDKHRKVRRVPPKGNGLVSVD